MNEQYLQLENLVSDVPKDLTYKSVSQFNLVLNKYVRILDYINGYNVEYKSATRVFYSDITTMRDNIQRILLADSHSEKENAFQKAVEGLKSDISALCRLIQPKEELVH